MLEKQPDAYAVLKGNDRHPGIRGNVLFYDTGDGTMVFAEVCGVVDKDGKLSNRFHGFHIHAGSSCSGNAEDAFADTDGHFTPFPMPHPDHAGDLPPLLMNRGCAWVQVLTERFRPKEIIGRTVVLHDMSDDFDTQPAGDSGEKIACGEIHAVAAPLQS